MDDEIIVMRRILIVTTSARYTSDIFGLMLSYVKYREGISLNYGSQISYMIWEVDHVQVFDAC